MKVGVLGATGMVGQRFIKLLENHPYFELTGLAASSRSAGQTYSEATNWYLDTPMPSGVADTEVEPCEPGLDADLVFSALPSSIAKDVEPAFADAGYLVASNASAYRMEDDVPLLVPEINPGHLSLLDTQRKNWGWDGGLVTNPNCSTIVLSLALAPLARFGIRDVKVATMQAVSGAGYSGVSSMQILDNVVPHIGGEEDKLETETQKILGAPGEAADFTVSARCNRVPVVDGHLETIWMELENDFTRSDIEDAYRGFEGEPQRLELPSAPDTPVVLRDEPDRPQPRLDRNAGRGMTVSTGRPRIDGQTISFTALGHNTVRGAAGASILNAELMHEKVL